MVMKKQILFLAFALLMSCAGTKKVTKNDVTQKQQTQTEVSKNTEVTEKGTAVDKSTLKTDSSGVKALALIEKMTEDFEARLKQYDTTKPIDPQTGKPPLVSELEINKRTTTDKNSTNTQTTDLKRQQQKETTMDWNRTIDQKIDSAFANKSKTTDNTRTTETAATPWGAWVISILVLIIIIMAVFVRYSKPK